MPDDEEKGLALSISGRPVFQGSPGSCVGMRRRTVIRRMFEGALLGALAPAVGLVAKQRELRVSEIRRGLYLIEGLGSNVVVANTDSGPVMVDAGARGEGAALTSALTEVVGDRPLHALFNTNWRRGRNDLNGIVAKCGGALIAHEHTRQWMSARFHVRWEDRWYEPVPKDDLPTRTFMDDPGSPRDLPGTDVEYGHLMQAHTDGDLYVSFRDRDVLMVGDVVSTQGYPVIDYVTGGWLGGMKEANRALVGLAGKDTLIIPARGPVIGRDLLAEHSAMVHTLYERMVGMINRGRGPQDMLADGVSRDFDNRWGDPALMVNNAYHSLWGHVRALGQEIV